MTHTRKCPERDIECQTGSSAFLSGFFLPVVCSHDLRYKIYPRCSGAVTHRVIRLERQQGTAHFYTLLPERIRVSCGAAAWDRWHSICPSGVALLCPRGHAPYAALRLSHYAGVPPFTCWSCEAWSHAIRRVQLAASAASSGLGGTPTSVSGCPKGYPETLLARVKTEETVPILTAVALIWTCGTNFYQQGRLESLTQVELFMNKL